MTNLYKSMLRGVGANAFGQFVGILLQVMQLPVLLGLYGVNLAGEWLLLSSIPAYIALSDIGVSNVAANSISMYIASGDGRNAGRVLHSLCRFLVLIVVIMLGVSLAIALSVDWVFLLGFTVINSGQASLIIVLLSAGAVIHLCSGVFYGVYRGCGQGARIIVMMNVGRLVDFLALVFVWLWRLSVVEMAFIILFVRVVFVAYLFSDSARNCGALPLGFRQGSWACVRAMLRPSLSFMMFPLGNAFYFQGLSFVVNATMGASGVVMYNVCRVVSRLVPMVTQILRQTLWLEYPGLFTTGQLSLIKMLQRSAAGVTWFFVIFSIVILVPFGPKIIELWTSDVVAADRGLLFLFLLIAASNAMWNVNSTILISTNRHEGFAVIYLLSVGLALFFSYCASGWLGLYGIGLILLIAELPLIYYSTARALALVGDSFVGFISDVLLMRSVSVLVYRRLAK